MWKDEWINLNIGDSVNIRNIDYAKLRNEYFKNIAIEKEEYHTFEPFKPRPIVIIYKNNKSNLIIAIPQTSNSNKKNFKNSKNKYWMNVILIINKNEINLCKICNKIKFHSFAKDELFKFEQFLQPKAKNYLNGQINKIKEELKKN